MKILPIEFEAGGLILRGKLYEADSPTKLAVLFLHGWTGKPNEDAAKMLAANGFTSMAFSLSGHNDSNGKLEDVTRGGSLQEAIAAYDYFKRLLRGGTRIIAAGSSYGSYLAALLSEEREAAGLSLRVPANYPDENFKEPQLPQAPDSGNTTLAEWRKRMIGYDATRSLKAINKFDGPIQIIEAEEDEIVPHQTVQNYVNAVKDKSKLDYHFMKGWPHSLGTDPARNRQYQEILFDWLLKL